MKYVYSVALAGTMVWLAGCASTPPVVVGGAIGPDPLAGAHDVGDGSLVIYSARTSANVDVNMETWLWNNDYGKNEFMYEPAHTDYTIYGQNGEIVKHVRNARDINDNVPTVVSLAPGSYKVEAKAINCDSSPVKVLMTVVVKPGQTTMAHLEGGWNPGSEGKEFQVAKLPCGRAIGWRSSEAGFASSQPGS